MNGIDRLVTTVETHPLVAVIAALGALTVAAVAVGGVVQTVRVAHRRRVSGEQVGTLVAAAIATGVSAQGMWVFFDKSLHLTLSLRIMFFAFLEIMVLTSALRARSAQQVSGSAGIDGAAMWVLTCLSAVLAATDADNLGTVLIRLSAPLVAAWGWERSMALERQRTGRFGGINWRLTPERILIRLGLADPTERTAGEVAAQRRLIVVALAADHARTLRDTGAGARRVGRATRRLQKAMRRAVEDGGLVDNGREPRAVLLDNIRILSNTTALLDLDLPHPWTLDEPAPPAASLPVEPAPISPPATPPTATPPPPAAGSPAATPSPATSPTRVPPTATAPPPAAASLAATPSAADFPTAILPVTEFSAAIPTAPASPTAAPPAPLVARAPQPDYAPLSEDLQQPPQPGRQLRRDPTVRARVRDLRAANKPTTEIAAELDTSPRTIGRILADLEAEDAARSDDPTRPISARNPAKTAVSAWHNGFHVLDGGNIATPTGPAHPAADHGPNGADRSTLLRTERSIKN
jgi:hypothetical protein